MHTITMRSGSTAAVVVSVFSLGLLGCGGGDPTEPDPPAVPRPSLSIVSGDGQTGTVGTALASPLQVRVTDQDGAALAGYEIEWRPTHGSSYRTTSASTGIAQATWTLDTLARVEGLQAALVGFSQQVVQFTATAVAGAATKLELAPRLGMTASGASFPLTVEARDRYGNRLTNPAVTWTADQNASVDTHGQVTGLSRGLATVIGSIGELRDTAYVRVDEIAWTMLSVGNSFTCGLGADGIVYCWGANDVGQLGNGSTTPTIAPTPIASTERFTSIATQWTRTCATTVSGEAHCWGRYNYGPHGPATQTDLVPVREGSPQLFKHLSIGNNHLCGLTPAQAVFCIGSNENGQLAQIAPSWSGSPVQIAGDPYQRVESGHEHACGLTEAGKAYCWGYNALGAAGVGSLVDRVLAVTAVVGNHTFTTLAAGAQHSCGLTAAGAAYCWGDNSLWQLGNGVQSDRSDSPVLVPGTPPLRDIGAGNRGTCGISTTGEVWCWGNNEFGVLGDGTTANSRTPVRVQLSVPVASIAINGQGPHYCATTPTGDGYCWGWNAAGQLGDGTTTTRHTPVLVKQQ